MELGTDSSCILLRSRYLAFRARCSRRQYTHIFCGCSSTGGRRRRQPLLTQTRDFVTISISDSEANAEYTSIVKHYPVKTTKECVRTCYVRRRNWRANPSHFLDSRNLKDWEGNGIRPETNAKRDPDLLTRSVDSQRSVRRTAFFPVGAQK